MTGGYGLHGVDLLWALLTHAWVSGSLTPVVSKYLKDIHKAFSVAPVSAGYELGRPQISADIGSPCFRDFQLQPSSLTVGTTPLRKPLWLCPRQSAQNVTPPNPDPILWVPAPLCYPLLDVPWNKTLSFIAQALSPNIALPQKIFARCMDGWLDKWMKPLLTQNLSL